MKSKKLSLGEMWELYKLLGKGGGHKYLIDEIIYLLESVPHKDIESSLSIMYGKEISFSNPLQYGILLSRGLERVGFFAFRDFMEGISGSPK